ncbi:hypothetical protein B0H14DRAFT_2627662 [Mycena olivaceomarginata]|nr:hypothetical protein B0H14DRAFT_2627662 [Mycena olivaceomarginata]
MPRQPKIDLVNITTYLTPAVTLLAELNDAFGPPFVQPIAGAIQGLMNIVQTVKRNKNECSHLMENIPEILYTIINLHLKSETVRSLPPAMLDNIGKFVETLHKIYKYLEAQQDGNMIKHLFRNNELQSLLKDCHAGLDQAVEVFRITETHTIFDSIGEAKMKASLMHQELLELIQTLSDTSINSEGTSVYLGANESNNSSNSFSMLPSKPKIFHGRESEMENIVKMLGQQSPRIAILGGGGMGKTSLARAVMHHPQTSAKFDHMFFVSAEAATTSVELAALIGLHVGLDPGKDLTKHVPGSLVVLDNLETVWEPVQSRGGVEEFLSLLTEVEHLALIITMRGAERPAKVCWTHPFLLPLQPLPDEAAQQTFLEITDNVDKEGMDQLLRLTDNMPLAVDLIAHLADYEGLEHVLTRWEKEKTALFAVGYDRKSNLDASITLSLSSPRITSESKQLLSLLSALPNGLSDDQLVQSKFPISNILSCKAALLATALAYQDGNKQLRSLMPIRVHIQQSLPPSQSLLECLRKHFFSLLELYSNYVGEQLPPVIKQITLNLGNLQEVLQQGLYLNAPDIVNTISSILFLNHFHRITRGGQTMLMNHIPPILMKLGDSKLEIQFNYEMLSSWQAHSTLDAQHLITQTIPLLEHVNNPLLTCQFYQAAGTYFLVTKLDRAQSLLLLHKALELSKQHPKNSVQCDVLTDIAQQHILDGDYCTAQVYITEAHRVAHLSASLFREARCIEFGAMCSSHTRCDFKWTISQLLRARNLVDICGLSGGDVDQRMATNQGSIHLTKSEYAQARGIYTRILETNSPDQNMVPYLFALINIALIDIEIGTDAKEVYQKLKQAKDIARKYDPSMMDYCSTSQAVLDLRERKFDIAKDEFQKSGRTDIQVVSSRLENLANIRAWPTSDWPARWPVIYCGYAYKLKDRLGVHKALLFLGDVFVAHKDEETATNLYMVALEGFTYMDVHRSQAECMIRLGDLAEGQGHTSEAISYWKAAQPLFEQSLQAKDVAHIDAKLLAVEKAQQKALPELVNLRAPVHLVNKEISGIEEVDKGIGEDPEDNPVLVATE